ncbi:hypothetical protein F4805DRAFT_408391 [Annulohypoxylon moriforme]|nr:hypothetical protein F4805DRAFT_408391 [Annulohypoxylon moriforme]
MKESIQSTYGSRTCAAMMSDTDFPQICVTTLLSKGRHNKLQLHATPFDTVPRWQLDETVACGVDYMSFRRASYTAEDIKHVKDCLENVIEKLNLLQFGLYFVYDTNLLPTTFTITHEENPEKGPKDLAYAFFPGALPGQRQIVLHRFSFSPENRDSIFNILCHEFGHAIGMRHWNAASKESEPSVHFPPDSDNRLSLMGPHKHLKDIQFNENDGMWLKEFYGKENGSFIEGCEIVDFPVTQAVVFM